MNTAKQKVIIAFLALFFSINATSYSQTEKQIVENYRKALQQAVDNDYVQSMELKGEFIVKKIAFPTTILFKSPNFFRMEMEFQRVKFIQVSNDTLKWEYNPLEDKSTITKLNKSDSSKRYKNSSTFDFVNHELLNYKEWNHVVKYKGKEKIDSLETYVLELTNKNRKETHMKFYIDVKNNLLYKVEDEVGFRYFANYTIENGYVFPRYMYDYKPDETMEVRFTKCIINKPISDLLFVIPNDAVVEKISSEKTGDKLLKDADSLYSLGKMDEAEILYTRFIKLNSKSYLAYNSRGLVKINQKEYYDAIVDFNRAIEIDPLGVAARNNLGLAKYYLGDMEGAIKDYTKALEMEPTYVTSLKNRGYGYLQLKDYEKAISDFKEAIKLRSDDGEAHFKYGVALAQLDKFDEAMTSYRLAIHNKFQTDEIYNYKGVTEYKTERYDSARISFGTAVRMNGNNLQYIENYGRTFYALGEYEKAIEQFENYLKKKNDQPEIHNLIGLCKYKEENYKGAIKNFSKSIELDEKNATYYDNRAAAKEMIEDYEGAIKDYSESIRFYPNDASVFYKRGLIKLYTSRKMEGCLDLGTAHEMKYELAKDAIFQNCN